jgi:hypothetical protein
MRDAIFILWTSMARRSFARITLMRRAAFAFIGFTPALM